MFNFIRPVQSGNRIENSALVLDAVDIFIYFTISLLWLLQSQKLGSRWSVAEHLCGTVRARVLNF